MNEWHIYALSCIWGTIDKLGDDAIDIYHAKHGTMFMEFGKIVRLVVIFVLLFIPQNIWLYLFIFIYSFAYSTAIPDEYLSDPYASASCLVFTILSIGLIFYHRKEYAYKPVIFCYIVAFVACIAFIPDGVISLLELWKVPIPKKIKGILNQEVGVTKLVIRSVALCINLATILIIQAYVEMDDLRIASSAFCMGWVCYYGISILSQLYHLLLAPHYTKSEETKNRRIKDKQVKRYDLKNMAYRFQKCMNAL